MQPANTSTFYGVLGDLVRRRRKALGRTQDQLARHLGLSRASIANIETGRQKILLHQLYQLASGLDMPVGDLLPPLTSAATSPKADDLPLPDDLSPKQKAQISQLLRDAPGVTMIQKDKKE